VSDSTALLRGPAAFIRKSDAAYTDVHDSIARMRTPTVLEPRRRDALRIIHEEAEDLRPVDLFRELRAQLLLACGRDNPVILVSGVRRQCGTSFVARNLAAAIALDPDHSAVLVDCNLRRPAVERDFDLGAGPGLSDHLLSPGQGLAGAIRPCGIPRLRVIGAGREPAAAAELVSSLRMRALLEELQQRYPDRCVVLDAPPARGAPEARVLAHWADRAVLVAGEGMHRAAQLTEAAAAFEPARFAGVVFNQLP
jgi:protein-tyrosine kinase